jgi:Malectin domain
MSEREALGKLREQAVRTELHHLLESAAFRTSKRCREFLTYIVEHTMSGQRVTLKERSIGVDLFQLPYDFDTGQHTIVRVTATEVRKKLAQHYLAENGNFHAVRIDLPPGSYSAEFKWATEPAEAQAPPVQKSPAPETDLPPLDRPAQERASPETRYRAKRVLAASLAAVAVIAGILFLWQGHVASIKPPSPKSMNAAAPFAAVPALGATFRMMVGSQDSYIDRSGRTWQPDRFFAGGSITSRPAEKISRTLDPDIYRHARRGDFQYDIPLQQGFYELHLHFAETGLSDFISAESSGEGQRVFRVSANGKPILDYFDVVADADGTNTSDERVFRNISPGPDGLLHLSFTSIRGSAILNGIELLPVSSGRVRPIRIRAGWPSSWRDSAGREWDADHYFLGGNALVRTTNPVRDTDAPSLDMALYSSERWGHFSYALPVPDGRYKVTLRFSEGHYGSGNTGYGGFGSRVFDVYGNGVALLREFDIYREAGREGKPIDRTFAGIRPNAQGKIILSFVPTKGMACVNGIEVTEDSK